MSFRSSSSRRATTTPTPPGPANRHHDDRVAFWCAAPPGLQETLVPSDPDRFFRPPYVGHRGWLGVFLDVPGVDWDEVEDLVEQGYRSVAPARLVSLLDDDPSRGGAMR